MSDAILPNNNWETSTTMKTTDKREQISCTTTATTMNSSPSENAPLGHTNTLQRRTVQTPPAKTSDHADPKEAGVSAKRRIIKARRRLMFQPSKNRPSTRSVLMVCANTIELPSLPDAFDSPVQLLRPRGMKRIQNSGKHRVFATNTLQVHRPPLTSSASPLSSPQSPTLSARLPLLPLQLDDNLTRTLSFSLRPRSSADTIQEMMCNSWSIPSCGSNLNLEHQ